VPADTAPNRTSRTNDDLRPITLERGVAPYAEGSCLVEFGATRVLCTASVEEGVPSWRRGRGEGWLTAEYAMLPRATRTRTSRERTQLGGRTQEIQRLIGRSLRSVVTMTELGERTVGVGDEAVAADLVARERLGIDEDDAAAGARQPLCRRRAGRTGADDDRVAAFGKEIEIEVHEGRASCRVALARLPGPIRQAATVAQAVMAPTSVKVS